jgi:hypothetical protein
MNIDLMLAVLSMDVYNPKGTVGDATVISNAPQSNGFAAIAYNYNGDTIISYRGTDGYYISDAYYGWGAAVSLSSTTISKKAGAIACTGLFKTGSPSWTRTSDNSINSRMLYQLSYQGMSGRL